MFSKIFLHISHFDNDQESLFNLDAYNLLLKKFITTCHLLDFICSTPKVES